MSNRPPYRIGGTLHSIDAGLTTALENHFEEILSGSRHSEGMILIPATKTAAAAHASLEVMGPSTARAVGSDIGYLLFGNSQLVSFPGKDNHSLANAASAALLGLVYNGSANNRFIDRVSQTEVEQDVFEKAIESLSFEERTEQFFIVYSLIRRLDRPDGEYERIMDSYEVPIAPLSILPVF